MAQNAAEDRSAMSLRELVSWAWGETPPVHKNGTNLLIHIIAVPLFVFGHVLLVVGMLINSWLLVTAILSIVVSLVAQKVGHSLEQNQVPPFTGSGDFLRRLYAEQFCNFWRFLFSGHWYASFQAGRSGARPGAQPDAPACDFNLANIGAAGRLACALGPEVPSSVRLDVFGKRMLVEWHDGAWRTYLLGVDGKRSIVNIAIPQTVSETELVQYFDDIYHEAATPQRPTVVRLP